MSRRPQRRVVLRGAQQRPTQAVNLARGIGRRDFMRATGGFLAIAAFGSACSEDGGPGATGRSYSDADLIKESIRARLFGLPDETVVHTGHGPDTTIGAEKANV